MEREFTFYMQVPIKGKKITGKEGKEKKVTWHGGGVWLSLLGSPA
jgi:hypothetical protein